MLHSISTNFFKTLCFAITMFLLYQLFVTYTTEKPTTTTKIEKELETKDLPNVVVCLDPGFSNASAIKYGYPVTFYWAGLMMPGELEFNFVGWNGDGTENKSSRDILEEMFLLPESLDVVPSAEFLTEDYNTGYKADVTFRHLMFPFGRCMFLRPSYNMTLREAPF